MKWTRIIHSHRPNLGHVDEELWQGKIRASLMHGQDSEDVKKKEMRRMHYLETFPATPSPPLRPMTEKSQKAFFPECGLRQGHISELSGWKPINSHQERDVLVGGVLMDLIQNTRVIPGLAGSGTDWDLVTVLLILNENHSPCATQGIT